MFPKTIRGVKAEKRSRSAKARHARKPSTRRNVFVVGIITPCANAPDDLGQSHEAHQAITACGGDAVAALRATLFANAYLKGRAYPRSSVSAAVLREHHLAYVNLVGQKSRFAISEVVFPQSLESLVKSQGGQ